MGCRQIVTVADDGSRVIIVRAWRDSERLLVRVLIGTSHVGCSHHRVFTDIDEACDHISEALGVLQPQAEAVTKRPRRRTIRSVDAAEDPPSS